MRLFRVCLGMRQSSQLIGVKHLTILPEFFRTEIIAAAEAEAHRLEELSKVEKLFDDIIVDMTEDE